jgi:hypothetical protein
MTIQHESRLADAVFTPLGTSFLEASFHLVLRDENDIVYAPRPHSGLNYRIAYKTSDYRRPPTEFQERRMLGVAKDLDPNIPILAEKIFAGCRTTAEKIQAVIRHFNTNYTYALGLDVPPNQDKLTYFLLDASTGYCEYFASGAAILLRLAGVPTRYVTGFLVTEQDPRSELWLARNMDAHAWVEAWDRERNQWTIVEATVGEDAATTSSVEASAGEGGGAGALLNQLLQALYEYGLLGVPSWLFASYGPLAGLPLLIMLLAPVLAWALARRYRRDQSERDIHSRAARDPMVATLHKMLARMDRTVRRTGPRRDLGETLHVFSQRLRARDAGDGLWKRISDWYLEYADLRYRGSISDTSVHKLQQRARRLQDAS